MVKKTFVAYPLDHFYDMACVPMPPAEKMDGKKIPEPYRKLLVHNSDMTGRLHDFCKQNIRLHLQKVLHVEDTLLRQVVLINEDDVPVEFGAIKIYLRRFSGEPQKKIVEGHQPLGGILNDHKIPYISQPSAYFRVQADDLMTKALDIENQQTLYGRVNSLSNASQQTLAEVVEILPPLPKTYEEWGNFS